MEFKPRYRAPALEKGLDILEALADAPLPLSQAELAQKLGRSQNEFFRMLTCLEERGYIQRQSASGPYRLTLRLYELGHKQNAASLLRNAARAPMEKLAEEFGQACHLTVQSGSSVLILMERMPSRRICLAVGEGTSFPMVETTSGKLLLSQLPPESAETFLAAESGFYQKSAAQRKSLLDELKRLRKADFVLSPSGLNEGVDDAAAMLGARGTETAAALVMSFLTGVRRQKTRSADYLKAVRECAGVINQNLGILR
jgi:DNA-binding IclR family transcriptional regulator